ncbi:MAG: DUF4160 domain-containing protein [Clostridia bacterium]|nr:DUF4160 domain-containing protein [Clostridia bacterium]
MTIARIDGLVIMMFSKDVEHPVPHIHVRCKRKYYCKPRREKYGAASFDFDGNIIEGKIPFKAAAKVKDWILAHRDILFSMWETQNFSMI